MTIGLVANYLRTPQKCVLQPPLASSQPHVVLPVIFIEVVED